MSVERDSGADLATRLYVQEDANGDVTALVDNTGAVVERYVYDPFGALTVLHPDWSNLSGNISAYGFTYFFQGGRVDPATLDYIFGVRDYDPALQRWTEEDPSGFAGGDTNFYRYCGDSPVDRVDLSGRFDSKYHRKQTEDGLAKSGLSQKCIKIIADADVAQDNGAFNNKPPFSDPANHGDNGVPGLIATINRIVQRWKSIKATKKCNSCKDVHNSILKELGKILHAIQDLYSHSNYVEMISGGAKGKARIGSLPLWPMFVAVHGGSHVA